MSVEVRPIASAPLVTEWLELAGEIINHEAKSIADVSSVSAHYLKWEPERPDIFGRPISLAVDGYRNQQNVLVLQEAVFEVEDTEIKVTTKMPDSLLDNPYGQYVWETFVSSYNRHPHTLCLQAARLRLQESKRRLILRERNVRK